MVMVAKAQDTRIPASQGPSVKPSCLISSNYGFTSPCVYGHRYSQTSNPEVLAVGSTLEFGGFQEPVFMLVGLLKITPSLYDISGSALLCPQTGYAGKEAQARGLRASLTSLLAHRRAQSFP